MSPNDYYGATKVAGELFLRAACAQHKMTGIVVRPGPVLGPPAFVGGSFRSDSRIAAMVMAAQEGRPIEFIRAEGRQFTSVSDLARVIRLLTEAANPYPTYLCVDRNIITWERIAKMVLEATGSPGKLGLIEPTATTLTPTPHFRADRLESLLGEPLDARDALKAHIAHLSRMSQD